MKSNITKAAMVVALLGVSSQLFAQDTAPETTGRFGKKEFRTWSIGGHAGVLSTNTIFNGNSRDFKTANESLGYGGYIKKQILPALGLQADFLAGKVKGSRGLAGINPLTNEAIYSNDKSFETRLEWSAALTAVYNLANISINRENAVLIPYVKAGAGYMSSGADVTTAGVVDKQSYREGYFIPVGAGFKLGIAKGINLDFGYDVNFVKTGKFDGMNTARFDKFSYGHAGLEFALGSKSKPQLQNYSSLANLRNESAEESADLRRALSTAEQNAKRDKEAMEAKYAQEMGDDDGDGVANKFDKCPGTPSGTVVDGAGCTLKAAPAVIREKIIVTEADKKVVNEAIRDLEFDLGKATIRSKSYPTLNRVAALLVEKNFSLKLAGHTDNTGSMALNLRLSKDRAEAIKAYLVSQGANASRIEATGYGPNQPIATNKTAAGRQKNRRVEFSLF
ncbi:OmpA family protein [Pedobacter steynii]|uniref:Flagellar motor protein MotB n=1 Tax=Pedobacter steynii TaxID=430522 RepID=A0A1D7QNX7_9SPHI|nr:OmpA family protein [Pedobacter steynii]AOM80345.1 flagellar motor protein MotB [Pedobacter steynii]